MPFVQTVNTDDGPAFRWGESGAPYLYEATDDDSILVAFVKAVNDGVESGEEIEGEPAQQVADFLRKAEGDIAWDMEDGFCDLRCDIEEALGEGWCCEDVALDAKSALCRRYPMHEADEGQCYVIPITLDDQNDPQLSDPSAWTPVETQVVVQHVEKAGRVLSAANMKLVQDAAVALQALTAAGYIAPPEEKEQEETEKSTEVEYVVTKSSDEQRYTLGPLYAPNRKDAHGEWTEAETLQKGLWEYVRDSAENGRRLNLQHGDLGERTVGEWVECMAWPYEHTIKVRVPGGAEREIQMPAGTVYMGVVWDEDAWPDVKSGKITGYSLGGRAVKVSGGPLADLEFMGDKHVD